ncbi:MAG: hypothetical protein KAW02_00500 [candidate division Zixibacteria bacterium]|nr:hypothetical protein [candidate division Zixibacteria bacterium]
MNHLIDTDPESYRREDPELRQGEDPAQLKFLEILIDKGIRRLEDNSFEPNIRDTLKAIQLKQSMVKTLAVERSETHRAEKIFWQEIEAIRREELTKLYPETISLESQIQSTILGLKHLVKNGILPVKIITDTFNQGRSKESQLSYRRIGQLLSTMGFRKAKTHAGTYAIFWDDQLLSQNTFSNNEKNEKQPSASPASPACPASS